MRSRQINFAEGDGGETTFILAGIIEQLALGCLDYKKERLGHFIKNRDVLELAVGRLSLPLREVSRFPLCADTTEVPVLTTAI